MFECSPGEDLKDFGSSGVS